MFAKTIILFSLLSVAFAAPGTTPSKETKAAPAGSFSVEKQECGNGSKVSCCEGGDTEGSLLGLYCTLPVLQLCLQGNAAACCKTDQDGLINVGLDCIPLAL